jgi:HlyD family secretion protein
MRKRLIVFAVAAVLLLVAGGGLWYLSSQTTLLDDLLAQTGLGQARRAAGVVAASGIIEAEEVSVTTETGGRVAEILADEADLVQEGQVVIILDDSLLQAQKAQREAAVEEARANLAQLKAGASEGEIRQAEAAVGQAAANRDAAWRALQDAEKARQQPQELEAQIDRARTQLAIAKLNVEQAIANVRSTEIMQEYFERTYAELKEGFDVEIPVPGMDITLTRHFNVGEAVLSEVRRQGNLTNQDAWSTWEALFAAEAARDGAQEHLENLLSVQENPLEANIQVSGARSQYEIAEANVGVAQAQLEALKLGATDEEVMAAEALVEQAQAALESVEVRIDKMTLRAPRGGIVLERLVNLGEIAPPNYSLLTLADLDMVTLTVYVPEDQLGLVKVGQEVRVTVDSYPERTFNGEVDRIATKAEFTPKNVQTKEERVTTVFAVDIEIPNQDHALKPGMPADAEILVEG